MMTSAVYSMAMCQQRNRGCHLTFLNILLGMVMTCSAGQLLFWRSPNHDGAVESLSPSPFLAYYKRMWCTSNNPSNVHTDLASKIATLTLRTTARPMHKQSKLISTSKFCICTACLHQ
eukprot:c13380_g2_i1 orf=495-848(-)